VEGKLPQGENLSAEDLIEVEALITEVFPGGKFLAKFDMGGGEKEATVHLSGKIRKFKIRVVLGDRVTIELSPYDLTKGRITYRHK